MRKLLIILFILITCGCYSQVVTDTVLTDEVSGFFLASDTGDSLLVTSVASSWNPTDIAGCQLWYADSTDFITKDASDYVSGFLDISDEGNDATQGTGANQPLWVDNQLNGKAVIRFDGTSDYMATGNFSDGALSQPYTMFIVFQVSSSTGTYQVITDAIELTNRGVLYTAPSSPTTTNTYMYAGGTQYEVRLHPFPITYRYAICEFNGASSVYYENGYSKAGTVGAGGMNGLMIGLETSSMTKWMCGDYAEIIIYNSALGTTDRQTVENYLATKYNLSIEWYMIGGLMIGLCFRKRKYFNQFKNAA